MKKIFYTTFLLILLVVLTSSIFTIDNKSKFFELPPINDSLILELPDVPFNYEDIAFPNHVSDFIMGWGADTSSLASMTNEGATLGRVLFYDVRLSGDNTLSCASCHKQEFSFADNVSLSNGIDGQFTNRNSSHLNDLGWQFGHSFFWDMRSFTLEDAVVQPILATNELGKNIPNLIAKLENAPYYAELFGAAFGSAEITEERIASALAQFINSMTTFNSKFDLGVANNFTEFSDSELNGLQLFNANCEFCHFGPHFGVGGGAIFGFMGTNGLDSVFADLGAGEWMEDPFFNGVFKGPTLKNIAVTAPFMHDGRFETLEEVIGFYSEGVQFNENSMFNWMFGESFTGYQFSDAEKEDLVAFLETLTDESFLSNEKWSNPWSSIVSTNPEIDLDVFNLKIYPNPAENILNISFENPNLNTIKLKLYDINGRLVKSITTNSSTAIIEREMLPSGVYKLTVSDKSDSQSEKVLFK